MAQGRGTPYRFGKAITKHDTTNLEKGPCDAIWVGGAGVVVVVYTDDTTDAYTCIAGTVLPVRAKRVNSTSTTATLMIALYN